MEIEVNDYVRLKNGEIDKVFALCGMIENTIHLEKHKWIGQDFIIKHSNNIIDLYVNGKKVIEIDDCKGSMRELYVEGQNPNVDCGIYFEQIETVLTHEQFSSLEYII